jgi:hypothetical protein
MKPIFVWISLNQLLVSMIIRPLAAFGPLEILNHGWFSGALRGLLGSI